jgi:type VI secretion system protein ImpK
VNQTVKERSVERRPNLAFSFQELFTAIVRVRFNLQKVPNADAFRANAKSLIRQATQEAAGRGYSNEDVRLAAFAVVAFLDESVLTSKNPVFSTWSRIPLQQELFGEDMAGETFFQRVQLLLSHRDSVDAVDVLEVYYLCLLVGYRGRYGSQESGGFTNAFGAKTDRGSGELRAVMESIKDKINRVRGSNLALSPAGALPGDTPLPKQRDLWLRRLVWTTVLAAGLAAASFVGSEVMLMSGNSAAQSAAAQLK